MHSFFMQQALQAARTALYVTSPNPRVGCVIVIDNTVVATGATQPAGGAHAEVMALRAAQQAGYSLAQATVYVTLEPCSHYGRTPPCVQALIQARPKAVVIAMADPNPQVAGQGIAALKQAGIEVLIGIEQEAAFELNIGFVARMVRGRPWLWLKTASSLDGQTALASGQSKWITGPEARQDGQHFRARSCLVLTGIGTCLADNPLLNVRDIPTSRQPIRAVVDSQLRISPDAALFNGDPVWVFTTQSNAQLAAQLADKNAQLITLPATPDGQVDLVYLMHWLGKQQINEVHTEAGAQLNGALWQAGQVDAILSYIAPVILGPGRPLMYLDPLPDLAHARRMEMVETQLVGADVRVQMRHAQHWQQLYTQIQIEEQ